MMVFNIAVVGLPTANYIKANSVVDNLLTLDIIWSGTGVLGYNIVNFPTPIAAKQGSMLYIYASSGAIGINTASSTNYEDFDWTTNSFLATGQNLYARVITQSVSAGGQTTKINSFTHLYPSSGTYSLYAKFSCNSLGYSDTKAIEGEWITRLFAVYNLELNLF